MSFTMKAKACDCFHLAADAPAEYGGSYLTKMLSPSKKYL